MSKNALVLLYSMLIPSETANFSFFLFHLAETVLFDCVALYTADFFFFFNKTLPLGTSISALLRKTNVRAIIFCCVMLSCRKLSCYRITSRNRPKSCSLDLSILIAISDPCMISSFVYERIDVVTDLM